MKGGEENAIDELVTEIWKEQGVAINGNMNKK